MTEQLHPGGSGKHRPFLHWILFAFAALIGIEAGAGAFTTIVVFPLWAASPEAAIGWRPDMPYYLEEGDFFMIATPLVTLSAIVTLIAGWRAAPPLRLWLKIATISFLLVSAWSIAYFVPIQDLSFKGEAGTKMPRAELDAKLKTFIALNYIRQAILLFAFGSALHALGLSYRMVSRREK